VPHLVRLDIILKSGKQGKFVKEHIPKHDKKKEGRLLFEPALPIGTFNK
jgi:hypothetical protein